MTFRAYEKAKIEERDAGALYKQGAQMVKPHVEKRIDQMVETGELLRKSVRQGWEFAGPPYPGLWLRSQK